MNLVALSGIITENIELKKTSEDKTVVRIILAVRTGDEIVNIPVLFFEELGLYMYENSRRGYEISLQGRVTAKLTVDAKGKLRKRIYIIAEKVTIHTPRYENALDIDDFIARYAPDSIEKARKKLMEKAQKEKEKQEKEIQKVLEEPQNKEQEEQEEQKEIEVIFE